MGGEEGEMRWEEWRRDEMGGEEGEMSGRRRGGRDEMGGEEGEMRWEERRER